MDGAAATNGGERGSSDGSPRCGASCHPSKLKTNSGWLYGVSVISSIASSTVGGDSLLSVINKLCNVKGVLCTCI